jgi:hypothetical protein
MEGAGNIDERLPVAEAHSWWCTLERTIALRTSSLGLEAVACNITHKEGRLDTIQTGSVGASKSLKL